jgi:hypothetical protein
VSLRKNLHPQSHRLAWSNAHVANAAHLSQTCVTNVQTKWFANGHQATTQAQSSQSMQHRWA